MPHNLEKLKQDLTEAFPHLSPNDIAEEVYRHHIDELANEVNIRDGYRLVGYFDSFCDLNGISYFAIANTLAAAVTYHDFIPGDQRLEIGMLREDFLAFQRIYEAMREGYVHKNTLNTKAHPSGLSLDAYVKGSSSTRRRLPLVTLCEPEVVCIDGTAVYGDDHTPLVGNAVIEISIFDAVPNDYDLSRALFFQLSRLNRLFDYFPKASMKPLLRTIWNLAGSYNNQPHDSVARLIPTRSKTVTLDSLLPTQKLAFGPMQIGCPKNTRAWVFDDAESMAAQVSILQKDALEIACEIDRICRENNIGYFICGGTMLGLVRHGGFIPWDDDIDVGMLREDYERFIAVAGSQLGEKFFLQTRESDPNIPYLFSKVRMKGTSYVTAYNELRDFNKGICVDVFPFDKVPIEYGLFPEHQATMLKLARSHHYTANGQIPAEMPHEDATTLRQSFEKKVMEARHAMFWSQSLQETQSAYNEEVTKYNDDPNLHYVASFVPTVTVAKLEDLLPYQDVQFEGKVLSAPAKPEVFLQMQYGDYTTMPMLHQQRGHDLIYWNDAEHSMDEFLESSSEERE